VTAPIKALVSFCLVLPTTVHSAEPDLLVDTVVRGQSMQPVPVSTYPVSTYPVSTYPVSTYPTAISPMAGLGIVSGGVVPTSAQLPPAAPVYAGAYDPAPMVGYPPVSSGMTWLALPVLQTGNPMGIVQAPGMQAAPWAIPPTPGQIPGGMTFGAHSSLQPYRLNAWTGRVEGGFMAAERTEGRQGEFGVTELDIELEFSGLYMPGWISSFTQIIDTRWWDGPSDPVVPGNGLPARVYRIGWDLEMATIKQGGYSAQLAFTPSLATDFDNGVDSDTWQFDGRAIIYYQYPGMTVALGAGYWDRVRDRVIPYVGVIFKPDTIWEWQLMFPESRISVFMGNYGGNSSWMYTRAEYHVEAYDVTVQRTHGAASVRDQIELKGYRLMMGFRSETLQYSSFIEAGWVFSRDVVFAGRTPGYGIGDGFMIRTGLSF
jgi:hypothetical protein